MSKTDVEIEGFNLVETYAACAHFLWGPLAVQLIASRRSRLRQIQHRLEELRSL